jgi:hypothetical protein
MTSKLSKKIIFLLNLNNKITKKFIPGLPASKASIDICHNQPGSRGAVLQTASATPLACLMQQISLVNGSFQCLSDISPSPVEFVICSQL